MNNHVPNMIKTNVPKILRQYNVDTNFRCGENFNKNYNPKLSLTFMEFKSHIFPKRIIVTIIKF